VAFFSQGIFLRQNEEKFFSNITISKFTIVRSQGFNPEVAYYELESFGHLLEMMADVKVKQPILKKVFLDKIYRIVDNEISFFQSVRESGLFTKTTKKYLDEKDINRWIQNNKNRLGSILLCRSENYPIFFDIDYDNNVLWLNLSWFEKYNGFNAGNMNLLISTLLYCFTFFKASEIYPYNIYELYPIIDLIYVMFMSTFGRKEGLTLASKEEKGIVYLLVSLLIMSKFMKTISPVVLKSELFKIATKQKLDVNFFLQRLSKVSYLMASEAGIFTPMNYNTYDKIFDIMRKLNLITGSNIKLAVNMINFLQLYGMISISSYPGISAYLLASLYPNSFFRSLFKTYSAQSYATAVDNISKKLLRV